MLAMHPFYSGEDIYSLLPTVENIHIHYVEYLLVTNGIYQIEIATIS